MKHLIAALALIIGCLSGLNAQRKLPFRIAPYEKNNFRNCLEKGRLGCRLDTMEYSGVSGEFNFMSAWALGKYRKAGNRGAGLGFGLSLAYQPLNKIPITVHGDIGFLYTDLRNQEAVLPVLPLDGSGGIIPYPVQMNIKNELFMGNIGLRYWIPTRFWQPFVMAGVGFISHNTLLRLYDDDQWVFWGTSEEGLLLESRIHHKLYGSRFIGAGVSWNAAYSLNLDFRFTLIQSQKFRYQSLKLPEEWNLTASQTDSDGNLTGFEAEDTPLFEAPQSVPFQMLMFSFSLTAFFE